MLALLAEFTESSLAAPASDLVRRDARTEFDFDNSTELISGKALRSRLHAASARGVTHEGLAELVERLASEPTALGSVLLPIDGGGNMLVYLNRTEVLGIVRPASLPDIAETRNRRGHE